ncbi:activator of basal transcription 1-like [Culex pipiens pallens]|uniref:activator of basal transcription 1-like n=1 Tax=Culex pipiens pallens TaxID=42434 RepID=UPI0019537A6B|nr:activator of basal transcription 1-like [Culex pipiens pallens]
MTKTSKKRNSKSLNNSSAWEESTVEDPEPEVEPTVDEEEQESVADSDEQPESGDNDDDEDEEPSDDEEPAAAKRPKPKLVTPLQKKKPGIIYISSIPKHMNVTILRELLEPYGDVGRIYLQPERKDGAVKKRTAKGKRAMIRYTEGWVEFKRKRVAKAVVEHLNTRPISTKKKSVFCDILWSMKYLARFKWIHLSERLSYERAVFKQKLRTEIAQARKEATFFQDNLDRSEVARKKAKREQKANKVA